MVEEGELHLFANAIDFFYIIVTCGGGGGSGI
jgi:hypothetical protein